MGRASLEEERDELIQRLRADGRLQTEPVIAAMRSVPREDFLPVSARPKAYADQPLEIGGGQTISAPHMVAIMSEALEVRPGHRVLEVGTGSGYQAAVLSRLVGSEGSVVSIERIKQLAARARSALQTIGASNVTVIVGDGSKGHPEAAPYDRVVVTAAAPRLPPPLIDQLDIGGILLAPVGGRRCDLIRAEKTEQGIEQRSLGACAFVPLKGAHGQGFRFFGH